MSSLENFKAAWKKIEIEEAKNAFLIHLIIYVVINTFLMFVNIYSSPGYIWFIWVVAGWGIGIAFHFVFSREKFVISGWEEKVAKIELRMRKDSE